MIPRSIIRFWLVRDYGLSDKDLEMLMKQITDEQLAKMYGLTYIRKGWFTKIENFITENS